MTHHELLETLGGTPDRVESLAHGLSPTRLTRPPREGEWSMTEILTHLLLGERDVIFNRLKRMLLEGAPTFPSSATSRTAFAAADVMREFGEDRGAGREAWTCNIEFNKSL